MMKTELISPIIAIILLYCVEISLKFMLINNGSRIFPYQIATLTNQTYWELNGNLFMRQYVITDSDRNGFISFGKVQNCSVTCDFNKNNNFLCSQETADFCELNTFPYQLIIFILIFRISALMFFSDVIQYCLS